VDGIYLEPYELAQDLGEQHPTTCLTSNAMVTRLTQVAAIMQATCTPAMVYAANMKDAAVLQRCGFQDIIYASDIDLALIGLAHLPTSLQQQSDSTNHELPVLDQTLPRQSLAMQHTASKQARPVRSVSEQGMPLRDAALLKEAGKDWAAAMEAFDNFEASSQEQGQPPVPW
jgi:hypothetical protein